MFGGEASHGFEGTVFELKRQRQSVLKAQCMLLFFYLKYGISIFLIKVFPPNLAKQN